MAGHPGMTNQAEKQLFLLPWNLPSTYYIYTHTYIVKSTIAIDVSKSTAFNNISMHFLPFYTIYMHFQYVPDLKEKAENFKFTVPYS